MATENLLPEANDYCEFTASTGTNWQVVDHVDIDDSETNSIVGVMETVAGYDYFDLEDGSGVGTISSVKVYVRAQGNEEFSYIYAGVLVNNHLYLGSSETLTQDYVTYSYTWTVNPATDEEWTWDEINAMGAGYYGEGMTMMGISYVYVTQCYVEVTTEVTASKEKTQVVWIPTFTA